MSLRSERRTVQNPLICYAEEAGWIHLSPEEAKRLRRGVDSPILWEVLIGQLQRLNPGVIDSPARAEEVARRLIRVPPSIEGNLEAWEYLRGLKTVFVPSERRERNLRLLDPDSVEANAFHVTEEFEFSNGRYTIRPDVVFLVNGIPVIVVEAKSPIKAGGIAEAFDQIRRYHREGPELMALVQLHALIQLVRFFYGPTWNLSRRALLNWREETAGEDFETLVKAFIAPQRVLRVLTEYIIFVRRDNELSKVVLRPHQMRAVERVLGRCRDPEKRRGLVWHTQGAGKTYTMLTVARMLLEDPYFRNPTVLMIVDRNELEQQLFQNLEEVGLRHVEVATSKRHLRELLERDTRGLIVSMIHKFDDMPANLNLRKNIFVLVDEAHRSTGGDLGNYLMGALPNATFIGFTGTPIDRTAHGRSTFQTFGQDDPQGYLDKYSIRESIEDGTTVPLHYTLAPNELQADREAMEREFWREAALEGVSDIEELNRVLDRAVNLKTMLKSPERLERVAAFVAEHFRQFVEPMGYKAFLVAVDREACALYKEALDRYLPPEYSRVVISPGYNDPPHLARYHLSEDEERMIRQAFRRPDELPKILIVTEKLLTGYDAPILYCMYLDKPMRDHVLLQAIARVNRPYEDEAGRRKTAGLIVDFVGIFSNLERALAFDSADVVGVVQELGVLKERFADLMDKGRQEYLPMVWGMKEDKALEAALERFRDSEERKAFYRLFRELEELYEILSPDPFLRPFLEDYQALADLYRAVRSAYEPHVAVDKSFLRKTEEIVRKYTRLAAFLEPQEVHRLDAAALARLAEEGPEPVRIFNLVKVLYHLMEAEGARAPYLLSIGERAAQILREFEARIRSTRETLHALRALVDEYWEAEAERTRSRLSREGFTAFWLLKREGVQDAEGIARKIEEAFRRFPHWHRSEAQERELRLALYRALQGAGIRDPVDWVEKLLDTFRRAGP
ncbi:type I restriction endonuclease subunit R [Thermoflexus hugenholtzii]